MRWCPVLIVLGCILTSQLSPFSAGDEPDGSARPVTQPLTDVARNDDSPATLTRGRTPLDAPDEGRYRRNWALIIGTNYEDPLRSDRDRIALPELNNAENDASQLRDVLTTYYGYDSETVLFLSGPDATRDAILKQLARLCDPAEVNAKDSVLVFFSGHGARIESRSDRAAIYPFDVRFHNGRPVPSSYIRMHSELLNRLEESPARHKLLILDSCYSGEIFNLRARPRSETDDRSSPALFGAPCVQAITSCRANQIASDGVGVNSPFTRVLLNGLRQLPARDVESTPVWANRLFAFMRPELKRLPLGQAPDCRNLDGDGEFYFFPDPTRREEMRKNFRGSASDYRLLQATVASEQGEWWFTEMPWFIPSLRQRLIDDIEPHKGELDSRRIRRDVLRDLARKHASATEQRDRSAGDESTNDPLDFLRRKHVRMLLNTVNSDAFRETLESIAVDLSDLNIQPKLEAPDLHLLAVVQHVLKKETAEQAYRQAIKSYGGDPFVTRGVEPAVPTIDAHRALRALCLADFGEFLRTQRISSDKGRDTLKLAANYFRIADSEFGGDAPASFRIFVLCREADAWLAMNRWADADDRLEDARDVATNFDPNHYLTAFVHRRRAWAQMMQWRVAEAKQSFARSNEILSLWLRRNTQQGSPSLPAVTEPGDVSSADRLVTDSVRATQDDGVPPPDPDARHSPEPTAEREAGAAHRMNEVDKLFVIDDAIRGSADFQAKIAFLHNLHGLAMALRFQGDTANATRKYRWLAGEVEHQFSQLRRARGELDSHAEPQLLQRVTNTIERLGDCNLFGDPQVRDLSEAVDDYRRAMARVHRLSANQRSQWQSKLFYKQALALSLPSRVQDVELALAMCKAADETHAGHAASAKGLEQALGVLTTPIVTLIAANPTETTTNERRDTAKPTEPTEAADKLRMALHDYRDLIGARPHRDQLELCLFACKVLLDHGSVTERFQLSQDIDLLLSFCQVAVEPYQRAAYGEVSPAGEARAYLRPYYDTAVRHLVRSKPRDAKRLLRIQSEATRGRHDVKPEHAGAVLAIYLLDGSGYLLVDLPRGESRCVSLTDDFTIDEIKTACEVPSKQLALPREITRMLSAWQVNQTSDSIPIACRWKDAVLDLGVDRRVVMETSLQTSPDGNRGESPSVRDLRSQFPFELPARFIVNEGASTRP